MLTEPGIDLNENLLSAWDCVVTGALDLSRTAGLVCNIVVCDWYTRIALCRNGVVVDTASFDVGGFTLSIDSDNRISAISESGETFLDATAKKIVEGDILDEEMPETLANLLGEVVIQLVARKRAPQLSERMLNTEPLVVRTAIDRYVVSCCARESRMTTMLRQGIIDSIEERDRVCIRAQCIEDNHLIKDFRYFDLAHAELLPDLPQMRMVPVILLDPAGDQRQMEERRRRHNLSKTAPYAVLEGDSLSLKTGDRIVPLGKLPANKAFLGNWYVNLEAPSVGVSKAKIVLVEIQLEGIDYCVTN